MISHRLENLMREPRPVHLPPPPPVLELPNGDRYHLHPRRADIEGYLAPDRIPRVEPGIEPVRVTISRGESGYTVALAPDDLEELLRNARLETESLSEHPPGLPEAVREPTRGRGQRDPAAHRLGPNVAEAPDPGHRGTTARRRKGVR
jgi:hypothetical protein